MRIVAVSDIHGLHNQLDKTKIPEGDVLVVAGDFCGRGTIQNVEDFSYWIRGLPFLHKLIIAGNHDLALDVTMHPDIDYARHLRIAAISILSDAGVVYLEDSSWTIDGVKFYGSPWMPNYYNWAFMFPRRSQELADKWSEIPNDVDVLITHTPPYGILDTARDSEKAGCEVLLRRVTELNLSHHIFGHVHEGHGTFQDEDNFPGTLFHNVAICNIRYEPINPVTVIDLDI